ncbi:hypothetical protein M8J76_013801 [Diaphorina citri]|nr:hypothetical protein M8J76_013801 [Diaphorina citri]
MKKEIKIQELNQYIKDIQEKYEKSLNPQKSKRRKRNRKRKENEEVGVKSQNSTLLSTDSSIVPSVDKVIRPCHLHIVGDSHVRGLQQEISKHVHYADTFFKPGAGYEALVDVPLCDNNTYENKFIYLCGTNDVQSKDWGVIRTSVESIINKHQDKRVLFILVPLRWDKPQLNYFVNKFNLMLIKLFKEKRVSYMDPNYFLRPWHYTKHGLHLNGRGKKVLAFKINAQLLFIERKFGQQQSRGILPVINSHVENPVNNSLNSSFGEIRPLHPNGCPNPVADGVPATDDNLNSISNIGHRENNTYSSMWWDNHDGDGVTFQPDMSSDVELSNLQVLSQQEQQQQRNESADVTIVPSIVPDGARPSTSNFGGSPGETLET